MPAERLLYFGESLGAAVVAELATEYPPAGLVLPVAVRRPGVGRSGALPVPPVRALLRDRYPVAEHVARVRGRRRRLRQPRLHRAAGAEPRRRGAAAAGCTGWSRSRGRPQRRRSARRGRRGHRDRRAGDGTDRPVGASGELRRSPPGLLRATGAPLPATGSRDARSGARDVRRARRTPRVGATQVAASLTRRRWPSRSRRGGGCRSLGRRASAPSNLCADGRADALRAAMRCEGGRRGEVAAAVHRCGGRRGPDARADAGGDHRRPATGSRRSPGPEHSRSSRSSTSVFLSAGTRSPGAWSRPAGRCSSVGAGAVAIPVQAIGIATTDLADVGPFSTRDSGPPWSCCSSRWRPRTRSRR